MWVWLPCDKSHPREIRETGKDWFGKLSVPSLSRKFSSYTPLYLCMHGGYVDSFLLSIKLSNDPGKVDSNFFCYAATVLSPHRNVLIFTQRMHKPTWRPLRNKIHLHSTLKGCFFVLKDFDQSQELKTIAKKSLQFYMFPTQDFFVIQTETRFCYMEDGWKVRMNICTPLWSFVNFCCLSQSEVSTDNRKVSTFFAFQHVRCRCCYRSYLDRFLIISFLLFLRKKNWCMSRYRQTKEFFARVYTV